MYLYYEVKEDKKEVVLMSTEKVGELSNFVEEDIPNKPSENSKLYIGDDNVPYWKRIPTKEENLEEQISQLMLAISQLYEERGM